MAVPTYDDLLAHHDMENSIMKLTFDDEHLRQFSLTLDELETLAKFLKIPNCDITDIKNQGNAVEQRMRMLERWKERCGSMATYEAMAKTLLQIGRTDLAEKVIALRKSLKGILTPESATDNQILMKPGESSLETPTSPASSSGIEDASSSAATSPMAQPATPSEQITQSLRELEEKFYDLVIFIEDTLEKRKVSLNTMTRRFSMLPQSVRRQHQTDESYKETRRRILKSKTIKQLFDNLTELKHWNYMSPDTLAHILKDVEIDDIHRKVGEYKEKLMAFKANTKLRELIGTSFDVPDYCIELTMEVEGWEDKTIQEVENSAVNIVRRYRSPHVILGWKAVIPKCLELTFILIESTQLNPEKDIEVRGVISAQIDGAQIDGDILQSKIKHTQNPEVESVISSQIELEQEFSKLVEYIEVSLKPNEVGGDSVRMLLQLINRGRHYKQYVVMLQGNFDSSTIKFLFDNLTELKHWNWMTPNPLENILKGVSNDDIHQKMDEYKRKLMAFKANTTLRDMLHVGSLHAPHYGNTLILTFAETALDHKIEEVERIAQEVLRDQGHSIILYLGWKSVLPGSIVITFTVYADSDIWSDSSLVSSLDPTTHAREASGDIGAFSSSYTPSRVTCPSQVGGTRSLSY